MLSTGFGDTVLIVTALTYLHPVSVEDYLALEEGAEVKHEYLGGVIHAMARGTNDHNRIAQAFSTTLAIQLRGSSCETFNSGSKVRVRLADHDRFYYPDGRVVCDSNPGDQYFQDLPVVIAEVLSDSTRRIDLSEKRDGYLTIPSLRVLLFIESDQPAVTVYRRQPSGGFETGYHSGLEGKIPLPEVEAELALADLFERVEFSDSPS